jgi:hypothetical protein
MFLIVREIMYGLGDAVFLTRFFVTAVVLTARKSLE